jgi:hypothetical protein
MSRGASKRSIENAHLLPLSCRALDPDQVKRGACTLGALLGIAGCSLINSFALIVAPAVADRLFPAGASASA